MDAAEVLERSSPIRRESEPEDLRSGELRGRRLAHVGHGVVVVVHDEGVRRAVFRNQVNRHGIALVHGQSGPGLRDGRVREAPAVRPGLRAAVQYEQSLRLHDDRAGHRGRVDSAPIGEGARAVRREGERDRVRLEVRRARLPRVDLPVVVVVDEPVVRRPIHRREGDPDLIAHAHSELRPWVRHRRVRESPSFGRVAEEVELPLDAWRRAHRECGCDEGERQPEEDGGRKIALHAPLLLDAAAITRQG